MIGSELKDCLYKADQVLEKMEEEQKWWERQFGDGARSGYSAAARGEDTGGIEVDGMNTGISP